MSIIPQKKILEISLESINRWRDKKIWYLDMIELYAVQKKEIMTLGGKWMGLEIMLSEISQSQKANIYDILLYVKSRLKILSLSLSLSFSLSLYVCLLCR